MTPTTPNARFWQYVNGSHVKITLRPGQTLEHYTAQRHEEGWSSEYQRWTHDGPHVSLERTEDGTDCDGRLTDDRVLACPLARLSAHDSTIPGAPMFPAWDLIDATTRDEYAEQAGY